MSKPFTDRLEAYLRGAIKVLNGERDSSAIFPNTTDTGLSREKIFKELLRLHAPLASDVFLGGFLFGLDGSESKQIDLIVVDDSVIRFDFFNRNFDGKSFACVEGAVGAFTIKSFLSKAELFNALDNLASIPASTPLNARNSNPQVDLSGLDDGLLKAVVAFDGLNLETIESHLNEFYISNTEIPINRRPNYIFVLGRYCLVKIRQPMQNDDGLIVQPGTFCTRKRESDIFFLCEVLLTIEKLVRLQRQVFFDYTSIFARLTPP